jgi:hypothetical protein
MKVLLVLLELVALPGVAWPGAPEDPEAQLRAAFGMGPVELLGNPDFQQDRSPDGFYVFLRRGYGSALVDTTGRVYWFSPGLLAGNAYVSSAGFTVLARLGEWSSSDGPPDPHYRYSVDVWKRDGSLARDDWDSSKMAVTRHWPRADTPIEEQLQLVAELSPWQVFVFFYVDPYRWAQSVRGIVLDENLDWSVQICFRPRAFQFEDNTITVFGSPYYSDSTIVLRLDPNGRRKD